MPVENGLLLHGSHARDTETVLSGFTRRCFVQLLHGTRVAQTRASTWLLLLAARIAGEARSAGTLHSYRGNIKIEPCPMWNESEAGSGAVPDGAVETTTNPQIERPLIDYRISCQAYSSNSRAVTGNKGIMRVCVSCLSENFQSVPVKQIRLLQLRISGSWYLPCTWRSPYGTAYPGPESTAS